MDHYGCVLLRIHNMATAGGGRLAPLRHVGEHVGARRAHALPALDMSHLCRRSGGIKPSENT